MGTHVRKTCIESWYLYNTTTTFLPNSSNLLRTCILRRTNFQPVCYSFARLPHLKSRATGSCRSNFDGANSSENMALVAYLYLFHQPVKLGCTVGDGRKPNQKGPNKPSPLGISSSFSVEFYKNGVLDGVPPKSSSAAAVLLVSTSKFGQC